MSSAHYLNITLTPTLIPCLRMLIYTYINKIGRVFLSGNKSTSGESTRIQGGTPRGGRVGFQIATNCKNEG